MTHAAAKLDDAVLHPSAAVVQRLFRASARSLMANRPMRELAQQGSAAAVMLSESELRALEATGLSTQPWVGDAADDPLTQTIVDYMALIETSHSVAQAAALLGVDVSRIRQRIRARTLFGVDYEGEWRLPRFQFERKKVLPGLAEVLHALPADCNPLDVAAWFLAPNVDLPPVGRTASVQASSPRQWLLHGQVPSVAAQLARHL